MLNVLTLEEAQNLVLKIAKKHEFLVESVPLESVLGRVLAKSIAADADLPAFDRSAVDGFAVLSRDTFGASAALPSLLRLAGEVKMGERAGFALGAGTCAAVWTGGELPQGADAMVMLEEAETLPGGLVAVEAAAVPGRHVVFRGDDVKRGEPLLPAGRRLSARDVGLLAALGVAEAPISARPRVGVLSTGDELIDPGETPAGAQIRDLNGPMLTAACEEAGADARFFGRVPDDEAALKRAMREAAERCDLLLLSGGSSAGAKDAAARCLEALGRVFFHGLALKPGKPTLAGMTGGTLTIGLPGHPAAAYLVFHALVRPVIAAMAGEELRETIVTAALTQAVPSNHGREELMPVRLKGAEAEPLFIKSGLVRPLTRADGYIRIPRDAEGLPGGARVDVILF